jgi:hypothetical protein
MADYGKCLFCGVVWDFRRESFSGAHLEMVRCPQCGRSLSRTRIPTRFPVREYAAGRRRS